MKELKGFPNYFASKEGEIYRKHPNGALKKLKGNKTSSGKMREVCLTVNGKHARRSKARLIYETYVGEIPEGKIMGYRNGYRGDTSVENLYLTTFKDLNKKSNNRKAIVKICPKTGEFVEVYSSLREATQKNDIPYSTLHDYVSGQRKKKIATDGYVYRYDSDFTY